MYTDTEELTSMMCQLSYYSISKELYIIQWLQYAQYDLHKLKSNLREVGVGGGTVRKGF